MHISIWHSNKAPKNAPTRYTDPDSISSDFCTIILISCPDSMIVVIDNTTKTKRFLRKLVKYLESRKMDFRVVKTISELQSIPNVRRYILSGSSQNLEDLAMEGYAMNVAAIVSGKPVFGICFGSQFLQVYHGGLLESHSKVHCGDYPVETISPSTPFMAKFCNKFTFDHLPSCLIPTSTYVGYDKKKRVCTFQHKELPHYGVLFHPEDHAHTHWILDQFLGIKNPPPM